MTHHRFARLGVFLLIAYCLLLTAAEAKTKRVFTCTIPISGVSDPGIGAVVTGVSGEMSGGTPFAVDGNAGVTFFDLTKYTYTYLTVQPKNLDPLTSVTPIPASEIGVSIYVIGYNARESGELYQAAERIPVALNLQLSGSSLVPIPAGVFDYDFVYPEFESNCTAWAAPEIDFIWTDDDKPNRDTPPLLVRSDTLVINASSGVSTITLRDGVRRVTVEVEGDDMRYDITGDDPPADSGPYLSEPYRLTLNSRRDAGNFKFRETSGGSGTTVTVKQYTR